MNYGLKILKGLQAFYESWAPNINGSANLYELWAANIIGPAPFMNYGLQKLSWLMGGKY